MPYKLRDDGYYVAIDPVYGGPLQNGQEYIYYKKNARVGDFWQQKRSDIIYPQYIYHIVIDSGFVSSFWGTWIPIKVVIVTDSILTRYWEYWSEEFGKVRLVNWYLLWGCVIYGVVYGDTTLLVSVEDQPLINPTDFVLYQNYPNPFNAVKIIQYKVPITSFVKLKVYDMLGKEIAVLVSEEKPPGNYSVEFNTEELKSLTLTSGTYFYELTVNGQMKVKKMILIK